LKKVIKILFIPLIVLCIIVAGVVSFLSQYNLYVISPEICRVVIGKTPVEFVESNGEETALENSGYTYAKLDEEGNLFLIISDIQKDNWKATVIDKDSWFSESARNAGNVEISKDYKKIILRCYRETYTNEAISFVMNSSECVFLQVLNGEKSENIKVDCYFIDAVTNEVKYHVVLPDSNLKFTIDPDSFSSKEQAK